MIFEHIQRALVIGCIGLLAGGVQSALRPPLPTKLDKDAALEAANLRAQLQSAQDELQLARTAAAATSPQAGQTATQLASPTAAKAPVQETLGRDITIAQAKMLADSGAIFIDARLRDEFVAGHVAGAYLLPADMFRAPTPPAALQFIDRSATLIIYCGGGACDASHNTAFALMQAGYTKLHIMTDGYPAWQAAGHAVEDGAPYYEAASGGGS